MKKKISKILRLVMEVLEIPDYLAIICIILMIVVAIFYSLIQLIKARLKNLAQHFGILGGILKGGVRDGRWEVSAVRAA
jgi:hypothetical protein